MGNVHASLDGNGQSESDCAAKIGTSATKIGRDHHETGKLAAGGRRARLFMVCMVLGLTGCTTVGLVTDIAKRARRGDQPVSTTQSGVKGTPTFKIGNPYKVAGVWYYPKRELNYDSTGIASWYGDKFAGRLTANGEIFDPEMVSAAHQTLPMPSVVRVTNLDLSREAARRLGFRRKGIAKVRVKILAEPSLRVEKLAKRGLFPSLGNSQAQDDKPDFTGIGDPDVTFQADAVTGRSRYIDDDGQCRQGKGLPRQCERPMALSRSPWSGKGSRTGRQAA